MQALALKELREVLGITAAALAGYLALVASLMGARVFDWIPGMPGMTNEVPFVGQQFTTFFMYVSIAFALALGFRQSAWESAKGTYLFLLHRPISRNRIFLTKLAVGVGLLLGCGSLAILVYGIWAATPGHHPSPFEWSMTQPAWRLALLMPLVYLGAFLSGLRPARWFGTRLLPVVATWTLMIFLDALPWSWLLSIALGAVLSGLLITNVCFVARTRDYA